MFNQSQIFQQFARAEEFKSPGADAENHQDGTKSTCDFPDCSLHRPETYEYACVKRCGTHFDSSHNCFLNWIKCSRNVSPETKDVERRTCPLLWCRNVCSNQHELLQHIKDCPHLSKGEYWCPTCSKAEDLNGKRHGPDVSSQSSQEDFCVRLVGGAKELFGVIGIVPETPMSQWTTSAPLKNQWNSRLDKIGEKVAYNSRADSLVSWGEDHRRLPAFFEQPARLYTPPGVRRWEQMQDSKGFTSRRPISNLLYEVQTPSQISLGLRPSRPSSSTKSPAKIHYDGNSTPLSIFQPNSLLEESSFPNGSSVRAAKPSIERDRVGGNTSSFNLLNFSHCPDLIQIFWEILEEHVSTSRTKMAHLQETKSSYAAVGYEVRTIRRLISMSSKEIASEGFRALQSMLGGQKLTSLLEIYAFVHIAYTSFAVSCDDDAGDCLKEIFVAVSQFGAALESDPDKKIFGKVIDAIWSVPIEADSTAIMDFHRLSIYSKHTDPIAFIIETCTRFLDLMERNRSINQSKYVSGHQSEEFLIVAKLDVTVPLMSAPTLEAFMKSVASAEKQIGQGTIIDIRQLELELIWNGKTISQSQLLYDRFLRTVSQACDRAHSRLFRCGIPRTEYHIRDIDAVLETTTNIEEYRDGAEISSLNPSVAASPINFPSPSKSSSLYTSASLSPFAFSQPTSSNNSSFSSIHSRPPRVNMNSFSASPSTSNANAKSLKCHICGYEADANGIQKWKPGNLKRHMRSTHNGKKYECTFEGCGRIFVGRKDNLLSHQRDKGHLPTIIQSPYSIFEEDIELDDV